MNRRQFFRFLAVAPVVAVVPALPVVRDDTQARSIARILFMEAKRLTKGANWDIPLGLYPSGERGPEFMMPSRGNIIPHSISIRSAA